VPIPKGGVAYCADNAAYVAAQLGGDHWAVKAQIHAVGRCAAESGLTFRRCREAFPGNFRRGEAAVWGHFVALSSIKCRV
jgi:hypothetical protein